MAFYRPCKTIACKIPHRSSIHKSTRLLYTIQAAFIWHRASVLTFTIPYAPFFLAPRGQAEFSIDLNQNIIAYPKSLPNPPSQSKQSAPQKPVAQTSTNHTTAKETKITLARVEDTAHYNPFSNDRYLGSDWSLLYDSLFTADSEQSGIYRPLIAEHIMHDTESNTLTISLHPNAQFANGQPILATDVIASLQALIANGSIKYQCLREYNLQFTALSGTALRLSADHPLTPALIVQVGLMPITQASTLSEQQPLSSSAYTLTTFKKNRFALFTKTHHYWASAQPSKYNTHQFKQVKLQYFKSDWSAFEAFKRGDIDLRWEHTYENWVQLQNKSKKDPRLKIKTIPLTRPRNMHGFVFNQHNPALKDKAVRTALSYAFDFDTINQSLFNRQYFRIQSFFTNTIYARTNTPLTHCLRTADQLLTAAGYPLKNGLRIDSKRHQPMQIKILVYHSGNIKIANIYRKNLARLGIDAVIQTSDQASYKSRLQYGDFDLAYFSFPPAGEAPAQWIEQFSTNTQKKYQASHLFGLTDPKLDDLIQKARSAIDVDTQTHYYQAIDSFLMDQQIIIPFWHHHMDHIAYWQHIAGPDQPKQIKPKALFQYWWPRH